MFELRKKNHSFSHSRSKVIFTQHTNHTFRQSELKKLNLEQI